MSPDERRCRIDDPDRDTGRVRTRPSHTQQRMAAHLSTYLAEATIRVVHRCCRSSHRPSTTSIRRAERREHQHRPDDLRRHRGPVMSVRTTSAAAISHRPATPRQSTPPSPPWRRSSITQPKATSTARSTRLGAFTNIVGTMQLLQGLDRLTVQRRRRGIRVLDPLAVDVDEVFGDLCRHDRTLRPADALSDPVSR